MKKIVLKTIAFTLSGVVLAMALTYGILALFSPRTLANMFDSMGNYSACIHYYERAYSKNNSTENLYVLCERIDEKGDAGRAQKYLEIFVESENYSDFCAQKDLTQSQEFMPNEDFYYGKYVLSIFNNNLENLGLQNVLNKCENRVENVGYTNYNPFSILIMAGELNGEQLDQVGAKIVQIMGTLSNGEKVLALNDMNNIESLKTQLQQA